MKKVLDWFTPQPFWVQFLYVLVMGATVTTVVTTIVCLIVRFFLSVAAVTIVLTLLIVGFLIAWNQNATRLKQIRLAHIQNNAPDLIFSVLCDSVEQLGILRPSNFEDVFSSKGNDYIGAAPAIGFEVFKSKIGAIVDYQQLIDYRSILQARIDKLLALGKHILPLYISVNLTSALTVVEVQDTSTMLYIRVAIAYDDKSAESIREYKYQTRLIQTTAPIRPKQIPSIPIAHDKTLLSDGVPKQIWWPYDKAPHAVVIGSTGSGKTYFTKQILHTALQTLPNSAATVCDFKADDFRFLLGRGGYYQYTDCTVGLQAFYDLFTARQSRVDTCRDFRLLVFDEWASYLQSLDKKQAEGEMKKMATLLMLGRSFGCHVLVSQQRGDAQYFSTARDNFGLVVALGNLSPESRDMFFKGYKDKIELTQIQGTGYVAVNGGEPIAIQVHTVNMNKLETEIVEHFTPKPSDGAGEA